MSRLLIPAIAIVIVSALLILLLLQVTSKQEPRPEFEPQENPATKPPSNDTSPQTVNESEDIPANDYCEDDYDCVLPVEYAMISRCPYEVRCTNGTCEPFCPWDGVESENYTNATETNHEQLEAEAEIWQPEPGLTWHWQLQGTLRDYDADVYDIDLFDTPKSKISALQEKEVRIICYFSAGSLEEGRPDADEFPKSILGKTLDGWPDEKWLDISEYAEFSDIMEARLDLAVEKGCDAVEADNVDAYQNNNGLGLTAADQLEYNKWLASQAHERGLSIGLKNDLGQVRQLVDYFDFAINEQCFEYDECELLLPFVEQGKAVFGVEYELSTSQFCSKANEMDFSWLKMDYDLDGRRESCR